MSGDVGINQAGGQSVQVKDVYAGRNSLLFIAYGLNRRYPPNQPGRDKEHKYYCNHCPGIQYNNVKDIEVYRDGFQVI